MDPDQFQQYVEALMDLTPVQLLIFLILEEIISKQVTVETMDNVILPTSTFGEDLLIDSLDLIELVILIEDTFDVEISDEIASEFDTVMDVILFLEEDLFTVDLDKYNKEDYPSFSVIDEHPPFS